MGSTIATNGSAIGSETTTGVSLWARLTDALMRLRSAHADREVSRYLARQPDRLLRDIGLNDAEIADLRYRNQF